MYVLEDLFLKMLHRTKHMHTCIQTVHNNILSVLLNCIVGGSESFEIAHQRVMGPSVLLD